MNVQQLDKNSFIRNIIYLQILRQDDEGINLFAKKLKSTNVKKVITGVRLSDSSRRGYRNNLFLC